MTFERDTLRASYFSGALTIAIAWLPGPSCIKQLQVKWEFPQPFPLFRRISLHAIMDKLAEDGLKSVGNTKTVQNPQKNGGHLQKFPFNLKFLCATGPW